MGQCLESGKTVADNRPPDKNANKNKNDPSKNKRMDNIIEEMMTQGEHKNANRNKKVEDADVYVNGNEVPKDHHDTRTKRKTESEEAVDSNDSSLFHPVPSVPNSEAEGHRTAHHGVSFANEPAEEEEEGPALPDGSGHEGSTTSPVGLQSQLSLIHNDNRVGGSASHLARVSSIATRLQQGSQSRYLVFSFDVTDNDMKRIREADKNNNNNNSNVLNPTSESPTERDKDRYLMYVPLIIPNSNNNNNNNRTGVWETCKNIYNENFVEMINYKFKKGAKTEKAINDNVLPLEGLPPHAVYYYPPNELLFSKEEENKNNHKIKLLSPPDVRIRHNKEVSILILEVCDVVTIEDCQDCFIFVGPTITETKIINCKNTFVCNYNHKLIVDENCENVVLSVLSSQLPVIRPFASNHNNNNSAIFMTTPSSFLLYNELPVHMRCARQSYLNNNYSTVKYPPPTAGATSMETSNRSNSLAANTNTNNNAAKKKRNAVQFLDPFDLDLSFWLYMLVYEQASKKNNNHNKNNLENAMRKQLTVLIESLRHHKSKEKQNGRIATILSILANQPNGFLFLFSNDSNNKNKSVLPYLPHSIRDVLHLYKHTFTVPFTYGANIIPPCYFIFNHKNKKANNCSGRWRIKLFLVTNKDGGWGILKRVLNDIEKMRKKHFLKYVKQHFPQVDSPHHKYDYAARDEHNTNTVLPLSDRLGPILLLNTAEIKCSELLIQEIVAPMFFTLCEPIGLEELRKKQQQQQQQGEEENNMTDENGPAPPEEPSAHHNGANKWFKFLRVSAPSSTPPLADGKPRQHISKKDEKVQQREEELLLEYNVEMRRLFGRTLERMTNQTCSCLLALIPPDPTRHSKTANLPDSSREVVQQLAAQAGKVFQPLTVEEEKEREALYGSVGAEVPAVEDGLLSSSEDEAVVVPPAKAPPADQTSWEQRVWSRTVLLNVTLPPRHISLLQSNLFFKAQLNSQNLTGSNSEFLVK